MYFWRLNLFRIPFTDGQEDSDSDKKSENIVVDVKIENFSDSNCDLEPSCSWETDVRRKKSKSSKLSTFSNKSKSKSRKSNRSKEDLEVSVTKEKLIP